MVAALQICFSTQADRCLCHTAAKLTAHNPASRPTWPSMPKAAMVRMFVNASLAVWLACANVSSSCAGWWQATTELISMLQINRVPRSE